MSSQITSYKCPACTGPMYYDGENDRLQCDYCGGSYTVAEMETLLAQETAAEREQEQFAQEAEIQIEGGLDFSAEQEKWDIAEGMRAYNCPSCGAELICDETTAALSCPYCDNPTIIPASVADTLKPDLIIPFKLDKEAAKQALRQHFKNKKLLPKVFSQENHIDEIKGVYVPFWLFDADAQADYEYSGTQVRTWADRDYTYTETRYFRLDRAGSMGFSHVPVDGSKQMDDKLMESIEPYELSDAVEFKNAYLAGYFANRYDVSQEENRHRAQERIQNSVQKAFEDTTGGYMAVSANRGDIRLKNVTAKYAFYPVWILNTTWRNKKYIFAMNGQTGKFVGDLPIDPSLRWKWHAIYSLGIGAVLFLLSQLLFGM